MRAQGWYRDPYGSHDERWFSGGEPTSLVSDAGVESHDEPPWGAPPGRLPLIPADTRPARGGGPARRDGKRRWTVLPPALLAFAVLCLSVLGGIASSAMHCSDLCHPVGGRMAIGAEGMLILAVAAIVLLMAGLIVPAWREVVLAVLWAVFVLACGCVALVFTAAG